MKCLAVWPDIRPPTKAGALLSTSAETRCSIPTCRSDRKRSGRELADAKSLRSTPGVGWGCSSTTLPASGHHVPRRRGFPCSTAPTRHAQAHRGGQRHHHKSYCVEHGSRPALWRGIVRAIQGSAVLSESKTPPWIAAFNSRRSMSVDKVLGLRCWTGIRPPHSAESHDGLWVRHTPGVLAVRIRPESTNCNYCPSQRQGYEARAPTRNYPSISRHPDVSKCGNFGRLSFWVP